MDQAWKDFIGVHTLVFASVCWIGTFFIRRIVETIWPSLKKQADEKSSNPAYSSTMSQWWNKVILYAIPVVVGVLSAVLATAYPFPAGMQSLSSRVFFGVFLGFFSSFFYKAAKQIIKQFVEKATGTKLRMGSTPPPPEL